MEFVLCDSVYMKYQEKENYVLEICKFPIWEGQ